MLFLILGNDSTDSLALRKSLRLAQFEYLKGLQISGSLLVAGPRPKVAAANAVESGFFGDLVIAEFISYSAAQTWADQSPYALGGVYSQIEIQPFVAQLPA